MKETRIALLRVALDVPFVLLPEHPAGGLNSYALTARGFHECYAPDLFRASGRARGEDRKIMLELMDTLARKLGPLEIDPHQFTSKLKGLAHRQRYCRSLHLEELNVLHHIFQVSVSRQPTLPALPLQD